MKNFTACLSVFILGSVALAQDVPLSQILKEGEGWLESPAVNVRTTVRLATYRVTAKSGAIWETRPNEKQLWYYADAKAEPVKIPLSLKRPTGLVLWNDQGTLVIADADDRYFWAFRIDGPGKLGPGDRYFTPRVAIKDGKPQACDAGSLTIDSAGRVFAATALGVQVFDPTGRLSGVIPVPDRKPVLSVELQDGKLIASTADKTFTRAVQSKPAP